MRQLFTVLSVPVKTLEEVKRNGDFSALSEHVDTLLIQRLALDDLLRLKVLFDSR
jgi:hypothetical protein